MGQYPGAIIVRSTTTGTTTTTSTTTARTTASSDHPARLVWEPVEENAAIAQEEIEEDEDYHNDEYSEEENTIEWGEVPEEGEKPSLRDGTIRLSGGPDDNEGNVE